MSDSTEQPVSTAGGAAADLDPQIRRFVDTVGAAFARYPDFAALPPPRMRQIAEEVRAPWTRGGPLMRDRLDLSISTPTGPIRLRVHRPGTGKDKPALIYLHGGGWTLFSIDTHDRVMREYAARADVVVIGVDYALSPEAKFPAALDQIEQVVHWAREHGEQLGIDGARIALGGDSAGGNLTIATCLKLRDRGDVDAVRAMVLNYSVFDRHSSEQARQRYGGAGYMLASDEMEVFWHNYLRSDADADNPLACPIKADVQGLPPAFLVIPECDLLTEQSVAMAERLRAAGVPTQANIYAGASHSFLEAVSIAELSDRALSDTAQWLRSTLAR